MSLAMMMAMSCSVIVTTEESEMYRITIYLRGGKRVRKFATLDDAKKTAQDVFAATGIVVAIERI